MAQGDPNSTIPVEQPIYQREANPRLVSVDARATPQDFGSGIAQGLDSFGKGLSDFSNQIQEVSQKRDSLFAQQIATKAEVDWRQNLSQAQTAFTLDPSQGTNYADTYKQQFNAYQEQVLQNNPNLTPNAKNEVTARLNNVGATMFDDALRLQAKASTDWSVQSFQNSAQNLDTIAADPTSKVTLNQDGTVNSSFDSVRQQHIDLLKSAQGVVPDAMRREENLRFNVATDKAEIDTSTSQNGAGVTAKLIQDGKLGTSLSIPQRQAQIYELNSRQKEDTTQAINDYAKESRGYQLQVQNTGQRDPLEETKLNNMAAVAFGSMGPGYAAKAVRGASTDQDQFNAQKQLDTFLDQKQQILDSKFPTPDSKAAFIKSLQDPNHTPTPQELDDQFYLNYMPSIREKENPVDALAAVQQHQLEFNEQVKSAVQVAQAVGSIKTMPLDDLKDTLDGLGQRDDDVAKNLRPIVSQRIKAIQDDPFTVTAQDDKQMQNLLSQANAVSTKNPVVTSLIGESANDRANDITQQAIGRSLSLQQTLNPNGNPAVMSRGDADFYVAQLNGAKSNTDMSQTLDSLKAKFGEFYPQALTQLQNNKNNPLSSGMSVVAGKGDDTDAKDVASAMAIPDGKGVGKAKEKEENPGYTAMFEARDDAQSEKDIDSAIQNDSILSKYRDANAAVSNTKETMDSVNGVVNSVGKYAKYLYLNPPPGEKYTAEQASDAAVKSIIGQHADFGNTNGVTYLINRDTDKGTLSDQETQKIKDQLDKELLDISSKFPMGYQTGNDDSDGKEGAINNPGQVASLPDIQSRAYWVTKSDLSGVSLFVKPVDGQSLSRVGIPVPNSFRSFQDMLNKANTPKSKDQIDKDAQVPVTGYSGFQ